MFPARLIEHGIVHVDPLGGHFIKPVFLAELRRDEDTRRPTYRRTHDLPSQEAGPEAGQRSSAGALGELLRRGIANSLRAQPKRAFDAEAHPRRTVDAD